MTVTTTVTVAMTVAVSGSGSNSDSDCDIYSCSDRGSDIKSDSEDNFDVIMTVIAMVV